MRPYFNKFAVLPIPALLFLVLLGSCSHPSQPSRDDFVLETAASRIAVVGFQQIFPEDLTSGAVESPLTGTAFSALKPPGNPERLLESGFLERLAKIRPELRVVEGERVAAVFRNISASSFKRPLRNALCETGKELGADLVAAGYLYRYRERKGESFSVEKPASVAFEIVLLRVDDGRVVWRGIFDCTQKSLLEDLFGLARFLKGRGRWLKAEELLVEGIGQVMETFPEYR